LQNAVNAAPDDLRVLRRYLRGMKRGKRLQQAREVLRCALFRNPRDSRYRALWNRFRFHLLQRQQRGTASQQLDATPCLLPFAPRIMPPRTPPPASQTVNPCGLWSRPVLPCANGVRPNSVVQTTSVLSNSPRCLRSLSSAATG